MISTPPTIPAETCNNLDDDCDTRIDEDFPEKGNACDDGELGACRGTGTLVCNGSGSGLQCNITNPGATPQPEVCNGLDDNCNGMTDENPTDVGGQCGLNCPGGLVANCRGACVPGTFICQNGTRLCSGSTGPSPEICNGVDDNCDGPVDNNLTDPWLNQTCCPSGNLADCTNTGGSTRCMPGTQQCSNGARACVGGVAKTTEVCNGIDDDCNGVVDDVAGIGAACSGAGVLTAGPCTAATTGLAELKRKPMPESTSEKASGRPITCATTSSARTAM